MLNQKAFQYDKKIKCKKIVSKSNVCTISNERHQVKTYMDNSNGIRNPGSNSYNKVRLVYLRFWSQFILNRVECRLSSLHRKWINFFFTLLLFALMLEWIISNSKRIVTRILLILGGVLRCFQRLPLDIAEISIFSLPNLKNILQHVWNIFLSLLFACNHIFFSTNFCVFNALIYFFLY